MSQIVVRCSCGVQVATSAQQAGSVMRCPHCRQAFRVPGGPAPVAAIPVAIPVAQVHPEPDLSSLPSIGPEFPVAVPGTPSQSRPMRRPSPSARPQNYYSQPSTPAYRHMPPGASAGSSLTSDKALRNTIIGCVIAITSIFILAAGWMAYERVGPRIAELNLPALEQDLDATETGSSPDIAADSSTSSASFSSPSADSSPFGSASWSGNVNEQGDVVGVYSGAVQTHSTDTTSPRREPTERPTDSSEATPGSSRLPQDFISAAGSDHDLSMPELIERVEPSIVRVAVTMKDGEAHGSGFVIDESGLIVTNFHVVEGATSVTVESRDGQTAVPQGFLIAEPERDLCVLKVDPAQFRCVPLPFATEQPSKGESVAAFGSPLGFSFSATDGIVSAYRNGAELKRSLQEGSLDGYEILGYTTDMQWVQTTAAISGGNSGGPLVNMRGEMVGVNTFTSTRGQNLNFAVSQNTVSEVVNRRRPEPLSFASLPAKTGGSVSGGVLPEIFGVESILKTTGGFESSSAGGGELRRFRGNQDAITDIAVSDDGRYIAVAGMDKKATVFNQKTGDALYDINVTEMPIRNVQFVAGSKYLTTFRSAGTEPSVVYRDPETGESTRIGVVFPIFKLASVMTVSPDGRSVFACWIDGTALVRRYDHFLKSSTNVRIRLFDAPTAGAFASDGKSLLTASSSGSLSLHELDGDVMRTSSRRRDAHQGKVTCVEVMPGGAGFVTAGEDGAVCWWKSFTKDDKWRFAKLLGDESDVLSLAVSPDGERIAAGRANGKVELFRTDNNQLVHTYDQHGSAVTAMEFFPNSKYFLTGASDGTVRILQAR